MTRGRYCDAGDCRSLIMEVSPEGLFPHTGYSPAVLLPDRQLIFATRSLKFIARILLLMFLPSIVFAQPTAIRGRLVDESGKPIPSVRVTVTDSEGSILESRTDNNGEFSIESKGTFPVRLLAKAPGYTAIRKDITEDEAGNLLLTLHTYRLADSVTVIASPSQIPMSRSTQSVLLLGREEQEMSPAQTVDDYLRKIPGFTLFRRSSSLVAHPTAQGVSLRGVGPSGASRSLVVADGIPLNDPFGGWVYWGRVPRIAIDRIELLRGGASELYGTDAMGGVIQIFRRPPSGNAVLFEGYLGNLDSGDASFYITNRLGKHGLTFAGEYFKTDGYPQVSPSARGPVDIAARSKHHSIEASWEYALRSDGRFYAVFSQFSEHRGNGTPLQNNDTQIQSVAAGATIPTDGKTSWNIQTFALRETFDALFSAVSLNRGSETLTRSQRVPAQSVGVQGSMRRALGEKHLLLAGADTVHIRGASDELIFASGILTGSNRAEGRQDRTGIYVQDLYQVLPPLQVVFGIRWDIWNNRDAFNFSRTFATGIARQTLFPSSRQSAWSPKLAARFDLTRDLSLRGSVSRSFRAPTLNELYRSFRVGNIVTNANPDLLPERARSGEIGADWGLRSALSARSTFFWNHLRGNIANVTLQTTPSLITRQRQNLGTTRSRGLELDVLYHPDPRWTFSAGYFYSDATVRSAPRAEELTGLRLPQVPRHQAVLQLAYREPGKFFANLLLRASGEQFDDDQNRFVLGGYRVVDISVGKPLNPQAELFFACENLLDRVYAVGRTPVETVGMPRRFHGGIRLRIE